MNRLHQATSPYLLQHADNPSTVGVGPEAFEEVLLPRSWSRRDGVAMVVVIVARLGITLVRRSGADEG